MKPAICEQYGIDFPLFAFSHCRDVVAAVTNAGGFGVLGATAFTPDWLDKELSWIDDHVGGKPYGVDLIVPAKFEGKGENLSRGELASRIPDDYRGFIAELLAAHDIEPEDSPRTGPSFLSGDTGKDLLEVAAGGIVTGRQMAATVAMGADGAWTGSVWLTTEEAETEPHTVQKMLGATSRDTIRSAGRTGKPARQLKSEWTDAWQPNEGGQKPLPLPLQSMLSEPVIRRVDVLASQGHPGAQALATNFVGQGVGLMNKVKPAREVVREFIEDYLAATERLSNSLTD